MTNKVKTPYGVGTLADQMGDWISVRLPINEVTKKIPFERLVTKSDSMGLFIFKLDELGEIG